MPTVSPVGCDARVTASRNLAMVSSGFAAFLISRPRSLAILFIFLVSKGTPPLSMASNKSLAICASADSVTEACCPAVPLSSPPASCPVLSTPPRSGAPVPSAGGTLLLGGTDTPAPSPPAPWSDFVTYVSPASILLASASRIDVSSAASCTFFASFAGGKNPDLSFISCNSFWRSSYFCCCAAMICSSSSSEPLGAVIVTPSGALNSGGGRLPAASNSSIVRSFSSSGAAVGAGVTTGSCC